MKPTFALIAFAALVATPALAQTYVTPNGNGGYIVQGGSQPPTYITPNGNGGYTAQGGGQAAPTYITPNGTGGYTVQEGSGNHAACLAASKALAGFLHGGVRCYSLIEAPACIA